MKSDQGNLELSRAKPEEAQALSELAFAAKASHGYSTEQLDRGRHELTVTSEDMQLNSIWTARLNGELAGWGGTSGLGRRCRLQHLWITPSKQRQGLGTRLLRHLADEAREAGWIEIEIVADPMAVGFYQKCGAACCGVELFPDGRKLPLMILPLAPGAEWE